MSAHPTPGRRVSAAALLALTLAVAACSSGGSASSSPTKSSASPSSGQSGSATAANLSGVTLDVGQTGYAQLQAALDAAGLSATPYKVKWDVFTGGDKQLQALQAGSLDLANASEIPPVFAASGTKPKWKAVATEKATTLLQEVDVAKGSPITGIADLKGKKVGYVRNTTAQYFLLKLLQQNGLEWTDIKPVALLPNDGVAALNGGSIAAYATYGNSVITIRQNGGRTIGTGENILSGNFVYLASTGALASPAKSAAIADLLARANQALDLIRTKPAAAKTYAQKVSAATHEPLSQAESQLKAQETQRKTQFIVAAPAAIASEQQVADAFTSLGAIGKVDVSSFWSTALNSDLAAALAKYPVTGGTAGLSALKAS